MKRVDERAYNYIMENELDSSHAKAFKAGYVDYEEQRILKEAEDKKELNDSLLDYDYMINYYESWEKRIKDKLQMFSRSGEREPNTLTNLVFSVTKIIEELKKMKEVSELVSRGVVYMNENYE